MRDVQATRYYEGRREGVAAYLAWRRKILAPMPMASILATTQPGCSFECPCPYTRDGWFDGFAWAQENRYETW